MTATVYPTILAGGSGTRLWPLSRAKYPKQFIPFLDGGAGTLLGATLLRLANEKDFAAPLLLCNNDHRFLVKEELERAGVRPKAIILEPVSRNTAPAIAVAALAATRENPEAILAVLPGDHFIADAPRFVDAIRRGAEIAAQGRLILFGVAPTEPHRGYGYIRRGAPLDGANGAFKVRSFVEKPNLDEAKSFLADGGYFWNSGIFVLHAKTFLDELARLAPPILEAAQGALDGAEADLGFLRLAKSAFAASPDISIDYAVMQETATAAVLPFDIGWSDIGSWSSLWDVGAKDEDGNYVRGDALLEDTTGCYVHGATALVATVGVENLVIVNTPDALLVANKSRSQDVSKIVARLKQSGRGEHERHLRNFRPWGYYESLNAGPRFQVKLLHVRPGAKLSRQMHFHRSEHWVVVRGAAKVTTGAAERLVREGESVYIVATEWHRLENPGKVPLELIEVQIGAYLGEDDIVRSDDDYNRAADETN